MIGYHLLVIALFFSFVTREWAWRCAAGQLPCRNRRGCRINTSWMIALAGDGGVDRRHSGMHDRARWCSWSRTMDAGVLIYGFAAAVLGGLTSPFGAVVGGFLVGGSKISSGPISRGSAMN